MSCTAVGYLANLHGSEAEVADDIAAALIYLSDSDQTDDPAPQPVPVLAAAGRAVRRQKARTGKPVRAF